MNTITIGSKTFTIHKGKHKHIDSLYRYSGRTLTGCYGKPSPQKQAIYLDWLRWSIDNDIQYFGVSSYNIYSFTLQGLTKINDVWYMLQITPTHNRAYVV